MKIIAIAHDPGGANAVAATVAALRVAGTQVEAYAKGPAIRQFQRLEVACTPISEEHQTLFSRLTGDILLTGTSQYNEFERDAILWARQKHIPSIAVIDYWANYRQRFQAFNNPNTEPTFPDIITAIDEVCAAGMLADGIPEKRIRIVGQPYFAWLIARQKSKKSIFKLPENIFFASQQNANEIEMLRILIKVLTDYKHLKKLLIRFHPRQGKCPSSLDLLAKSSFPFAIDESPNILDTLQQQDIVLGITSIILIEAALMGIPTGSLVMGVNDTLITKKWGFTLPLNTPEKLQEFLYFTEHREIDKQFFEQQCNADYRVAQLCKAII
ncbi:MAG: hypothetical protein RMY64_08240 [Nostoc sp. DedQUE08]|uniref:hypothetical protein n=1 Tax=unclassified Nostoc TaxID=2593658 RepID=UPI002AD283B3|nr:MULTISPECIES: hypothetical protein [unclassified Nostoc]MDZ8065616.1 hypothetical protein [Nostoc sp. DedQUE08]MDZ8091366.1 hypothetical protein [Nostoc sp. DedQUE05]